MSALLPNLDTMSVKERLQAMEELWQSLTPEVRETQVPDWHGAELAETRARYLAGLETPIPWEEAKAKLRILREG